MTTEQISKFTQTTDNHNEDRYYLDGWDMLQQWLRMGDSRLDMEVSWELLGSIPFDI